jgi:prepilin-type processing-associated H-X9-DG protein
VTSYAGNGGTRSYYPNLIPVDPAKGEDKPNGVLFTTGPDSAPVKSQKAVRLAEITDGTSNTILGGEKYNADVAFDALPESQRSGLLMHQWALWGMSGGFKVTGHVIRGSAVRINFNVAECQASGSPSGYTCQDERLNAWGSGHTGGANFVLCDGSTRFVSDSIATTILGAVSTRAYDETLALE